MSMNAPTFQFLDWVLLWALCCLWSHTPCSSTGFGSVYFHPDVQQNSHVRYLWGKILWNVWSIGDGAGMHKMQPKNSRRLLQLWNSSGVTTRVLQIVANKRWTYQIHLVCLFFLFPLPVRIHNHIIHNFLKAKNKIWVFSTFSKENYNLMHIHILPCRLFPQAKMYWKFCFRQNCKKRQRRCSFLKILRSIAKIL